MTSIVIVGAGQAGGTAALQLRAAGFEGDIALIGQNHIRPTSARPCRRPTSPASYESLLLRPAELYEAQRIRLLTDTSIASIDLAKHSVTASDGRVLPFDKLLLATGAGPGNCRSQEPICRGCII